MSDATTSDAATPETMQPAVETPAEPASMAASAPEPAIDAVTKPAEGPRPGGDASEIKPASVQPEEDLVATGPATDRGSPAPEAGGSELHTGLGQNPSQDLTATRPIPAVPPQVKPEHALDEDAIRPTGRIPVLELDQAGPSLSGPRADMAAAQSQRSALSRYGAQAAMLAIAIGAGFGIANYAGQGERQAAPALAEANAALKQSREESARLEADLRSLKGSVETLKGGLERGKGDPARLAQLSERLERSERANQDATAKIARLTEQLDKAQREPARLTERLERVERQVASERASASAAAHPPASSAAATPPPAPPAQAAAQLPIPTPPVKPSAAEMKNAAEEAPSRTGSIPEAKDGKDTKPAAKAASSEAPAAKTASVEPAAPKPVNAKEISPKSVRLEGWTLRDVDGRNALVEDKDGRLREVSVGSALPNAGKVESIDRRGKSWVVVTQKGFIGQDH